jgi:hypothetical protein
MWKEVNGRWKKIYDGAFRQKAMTVSTAICLRGILAQY